MRTINCRCIKEIDNFNFEIGKVYEGEIRDSELWITILGPSRDQETYVVQALFDKCFEII